MWDKQTAAGVQSAIRTRVDGVVRLRLERAQQPYGGGDGPAPLWKSPLNHTFEVRTFTPSNHPPS